MAIRNRIRVEVLVQRAAVLQEADAELGEVERILRLEETGMAGACANCGAPHSVGRLVLLAVRPAAAGPGHPGRDRLKRPTLRSADVTHGASGGASTPAAAPRRVTTSVT